MKREQFSTASKHQSQWFCYAVSFSPEVLQVALQLAGGEARCSVSNEQQHRTCQYTAQLVQLETQDSHQFLARYARPGFQPISGLIRSTVGFRDVIFFKSSITTTLNSNCMNCAGILGMYTLYVAGWLAANVHGFTLSTCFLCKHILWVKGMHNT